MARPKSTGVQWVSPRRGQSSDLLIYYSLARNSSGKGFRGGTQVEKLQELQYFIGLATESSSHLLLIWLNFHSALNCSVLYYVDYLSWAPDFSPECESNSGLMLFISINFAIVSIFNVATFAKIILFYRVRMITILLMLSLCFRINVVKTVNPRSASRRTCTSSSRPCSKTLYISSTSRSPSTSSTSIQTASGPFSAEPLSGNPCTLSTAS